MSVWICDRMDRHPHFIHFVKRSEAEKVFDEYFAGIVLVQFEVLVHTIVLMIFFIILRFSAAEHFKKNEPIIVACQRK